MALAKLRFFGHCIRKDGSLEKAILLGLTEGRRRRGRPRRRWIDTVTSDSQLIQVNAIVFVRVGVTTYGQSPGVDADPTVFS